MIRFFESGKTVCWLCGQVVEWLETGAKRLRLKCVRVKLEMCMGMGFPVGMGIPWEWE